MEGNMKKEATTNTFQNATQAPAAPVAKAEPVMAQPSVKEPKPAI